VLSRFNQRFQDIMLVNAACSTLTLHLVSQLPGEKELCSTMVRYVNLVMHLSYMALNGALDDADFQLLRKRKLLLGRDEEDKLRAHERGACTVAQVPYTWVMRMVATLRRDGRFTENEAMRFEQELTLLRSRASRQNTYQTCSIPKPYFHLQTLLMNIYLLLQEWNSAHDVAMQYCKDGMMATLTSTHETTTINSYDGSIVEDGMEKTVLKRTCTLFSSYVAVSLQFFGMIAIIVGLIAMWKVSVWLSNPVGSDVIDYDLDHDLVKAWYESQYAVSIMTSDKDMPDTVAEIVDKVEGLYPRTDEKQSPSSELPERMVSCASDTGSILLASHVLNSSRQEESD